MICVILFLHIRLIYNQGEEGVRKVLEIIRDELNIAMALSGEITLVFLTGNVLFVDLQCILSV